MPWTKCRNSSANARFAKFFWALRSAVWAFVIFFWANNSAKAQFIFADSVREERSSAFEQNRLAFNFYNSNFFVDNEYSGEKTSGYTLPGFRFTPTLSYEMGKVFLEAGVSFLHYHGANRYPCTVYAALPSWQGYQYMSGVHLVPFFRAMWQMGPHFRLTFGNLDRRNSHFLTEPLYNVENTFASDPEAGVQITYEGRFHSSDAWVDWRSFVFGGDIHQETFTFAYSSNTFFSLFSDRFRIRIPLAAILQHLGGENLGGDFEIQTWANLSAGLKAEYAFTSSLSLAAGCDIFFYKELSGTGIMPFKQGWAAFPQLEIKYKRLSVKVAYYDSEDFVSLLGSPHFSNFSSNTPDLVFDRANQYYARATYSFNILKGCEMNLYFQLFHQNRITGDRPGFDKVIRSGFTSFSLGAILNLRRSLTLKRFS